MDRWDRCFLSGFKSKANLYLIFFPGIFFLMEERLGQIIYFKHLFCHIFSSFVKGQGFFFYFWSQMSMYNMKIKTILVNANLYSLTEERQSCVTEMVIKVFTWVDGCK